ncbi:MAG: DeoR/GlpR transcriptional regulator [Clostridia bacterium]|nr:DeoR/GlpR transcriptional regulator [Clostridia bacterium]
MPFYEREDKIIEVLMKKQNMTVEEISKELFISKPTVRRDLIKLENKGLIIRTRGGATLKNKSADTKIPFFLREQEHSEAKQIMAKKAVKFISDGDTIMIDATTSALSIIPYLSDFHDIIVITNSAKASVLLGSMGIKNISTGGLMIPKLFSYVGKEAQRTILDYNADIMFFSCRSLSEDGYLSDNSLEENAIRLAMMSRSKKKVLLCDSTKLNKKSLNNLCHLREIDEIICEKQLPENIIKTLKKKGSK